MLDSVQVGLYVQIVQLFDKRVENRAYMGASGLRMPSHALNIGSKCSCC